jgi:hypothetical protein
MLGQTIGHVKNLFRASLQTGGVSIAGPGKYAIDFAKLTGL